jgi:hypothetical protein
MKKGIASSVNFTVAEYTCIGSIPIKVSFASMAPKLARPSDNAIGTLRNNKTTNVRNKIAGIDISYPPFS